ncbi:RNA polymerase sigma factor FliA [Ectothiorhodospiraceae bacterium BW-2]|nr:RNA polymerase sigma factor FliA [Ectothiorhodospiraceae bacterium BW-2]
MYDAKGLQQLNRDQLVNQHAPLVKKIAYHLIGRLPASVQVDDLIQAGMMGLLDAAVQYDQSQGAQFETYATIRVRGSMLDELRRNDWVPKSVHRKSRELTEAINRVEGRLGRDASDREVAAEMGLALEEYHKILQDHTNCRMTSLETLTVDEEGDDPLERHASSDLTPSEHLIDFQFQEGLVDAIEHLPEREKLIMSLYYEQDLNLKEIGLILEVSESRISQLMSQAHGRLRSRLRDHIH